MVYHSRADPNKVALSLREYKDNQKTLISFCIQVPAQMSQNGRKESIFKNSRLMLHEIITNREECKSLEKIPDNEIQRGSISMLAPDQRLEVVKITRCKMR